MKKCPFCAEEILDDAIVCRYCGRDLSGGTFQPAVPGGARALATISALCGFIGLFVFGIPLGVIALACGIPALATGAGGGRAGIVLGNLDIVLVGSGRNGPDVRQLVVAT